MIVLPKNKVLDLFSGAGGMAEGFLQAGFEVPYGTDINVDAARTYINRHEQLGYKIKFHCGNIIELVEENNLKDFLGEDFENIGIVCGGPPCQGFSLAGQRKANDPRNQLVKSYIKVLHLVKPLFFVMENVTGILSATFEEYIGIKGNVYKNTAVTEVLLNEFRSIGYEVEYEVLNAADYGVPQNRKRVIFIGKKKEFQDIPILFPEAFDYKVSAEEALSDLNNIGNGEKVRQYTIKAESVYQKESKKGRTPKFNGKNQRSKIIRNHETSKHTDLVSERFSILQSGETVQQLLDRLPSRAYKKYYTKKQNCKRMIAGEPSPTVMTLPDDMVHYSENRILTVREMARLQSFDDSFEFLGKRTTGGDRRKFELPQYTLVGNAVPPLLANAVALRIKTMIEGISESSGNPKT